MTIRRVVRIARNGDVYVGHHLTPWFVARLDAYYWSAYFCDPDDRRYADIAKSLPRLSALRAWLQELPDDEFLQ